MWISSSGKQIIDSGPSRFASKFYLPTCAFAQRAVLYLVDVSAFTYSNWVFVLVAAVVFTVLHLRNACTYACHDMYVEVRGKFAGVSSAPPTTWIPELELEKQSYHTAHSFLIFVPWFFCTCYILASVCVPV